MIDILKRKKTFANPIEIDVHSHLLPGIDDGVESFEEALEILKVFKALGYKKVITTPHVMVEFYPNTPEIINEKLATLKEAVRLADLDIVVEAAAEYYLDEAFLALLDTPEKLMVFGENYILFETPFINEPVFLKEAVFKMSALGLQPVLAHPERYMFVQANPGILEQLAERNVLFQCNINAIDGYYSPVAEKTAKFMLNKGMVSFLGSDCHNIKHAHLMKQTLEKKYFQKLEKINLKNNTL